MTIEKESDVIKLANEVVFEYTMAETISSSQRLEKERHGEGCGCRSCQQTAVLELNLWLDFLDPGLKYPRYELIFDEGGKTIIEEISYDET